jgi:hypothetical protein
MRIPVVTSVVFSLPRCEREGTRSGPLPHSNYSLTDLQRAASGPPIDKALATTTLPPTLSNYSLEINRAGQGVGLSPVIVQ